MDERCEIEVSPYISVRWLCNVWNQYPKDRYQMIVGFQFLSTFLQFDMRDELKFLLEIAHVIDREGGGRGYH